LRRAREDDEAARLSHERKVSVTRNLSETATRHSPCS
jgi:hypothetical protein